MRATQLFMAGAVDLSFGADYRAPTPAGQGEAAVLGAPAFDDVWIRGGWVRGKVISTRLANVDGSELSVQWLQHHLSDMRAAETDSRAAG